MIAAAEHQSAFSQKQHKAVKAGGNERTTCGRRSWKYAPHDNHHWPSSRGWIGSFVAPWESCEQGPDRSPLGAWREYSWGRLFEREEAHIDLSEISQGAPASAEARLKRGNETPASAAFFFPYSHKENQKLLKLDSTLTNESVWDLLWWTPMEMSEDASFWPYISALNALLLRANETSVLKPRTHLHAFRISVGGSSPDWMTWDWIGLQLSGWSVPACSVAVQQSDLTLTSRRICLS